MKNVLFQGDSITDCSRDRSDWANNTRRPSRLGTGYPLLAASRLALDFPGEYNVENRGISGNRIVDLYARIKVDFINLRPDFLSILIGVNDVWHEIDHQNGVSAKKFESVYRLILDEITAELPACKILLLAPYVLPGAATVNEEKPERWEYFRTEVSLRAEAVKRIARDYPVSLIETQPLFDEAQKHVDPIDLLVDGVHPGPAGHELLARHYMDWFRSVR